MEEKATAISDEVGIKTELEKSNSSDNPRPSSNGSESQKRLQHTDIIVNQGHKRKKLPEGMSGKKPRETDEKNSANNSDDESDTGDYCMIISEVSKLLVVDKLLKECDIVLASKEKISKHQVKLSFRSSEDVLELQKKLKERGLNWTVATMPPGQDNELLDNVSDTTEVVPESLWKPDEEDDDPLGLYGLRIEFLKTLDITPPLDRWVHVTNFRCDKHELRDVLELAGRVLSCSVAHITKKYAKVQYSHPLEAVQAVSLFNGQTFYGQKLKVYMERNPFNDLLLPKGLSNIGLGLGLEGRPIRDIERQYEKFIEHEKSNLNPVLFRRSNNEDDGLFDYNTFMASVDDRSFNVKQAFEHNSQTSESSDLAKMNCSPDSNSVKSAKSPASTFDDISDKSLEFSKTDASSGTQQPEVPGSTNPINQPANEPCVNRITTISARSHVVFSASFRSGPVGPQVHQFQAPSNQFPSAILHGPSNIHHSMPNPSTSNPLAYSQTPQMPGVGPGPISRPELIRGPGLAYGTGPTHIGGPGINHAPGPIHRPGPVQGPGPIQGPGPVQGPRPGQVAGQIYRPGYVRGPGPNAMPAPGPMGISNNRATVQLSNLPPSTTFPLLCEKLSLCGQVMSLQFTTPGCAIVTYGHLSHAQKCFQTYNGMTVEGYTIAVTFL